MNNAIAQWLMVIILVMRQWSIVTTACAVRIVTLVQRLIGYKYINMNSVIDAAVYRDYSVIGLLAEADFQLL
ncbi:MAG: hypothetical protein ABJI18_08555 [Lentilitoribacter sp.]